MGLGETKRKSLKEKENDYTRYRAPESQCLSGFRATCISSSAKKENVLLFQVRPRDPMSPWERKAGFCPGTNRIINGVLIVQLLYQ